jgi:VanZ family protein
MTLKTLLLITAGLWTLAIAVGCLTPAEDLPDVASRLSDKAMHAGIFAGFSGLWLLAGQGLRRVLLIGVLYGGLLEVLQTVLPIHRSGDWLDLTADTIGLLVGAGLTVLFRRYVLHRG